MPTAPAPSSRIVTNGSAEVRAVELPPAATGRRDAALAAELHEPADEDGDDSDDQATAERLHARECRAEAGDGVRPVSGTSRTARSKRSGSRRRRRTRHRRFQA